MAYLLTLCNKFALIIQVRRRRLRDGGCLCKEIRNIKGLPMAYGFRICLRKVEDIRREVSAELKASAIKIEPMTREKNPQAANSNLSGCLR